jgi:hypothetical protein
MGEGMAFVASYSNNGSELKVRVSCSIIASPYCHARANEQQQQHSKRITTTMIMIKVVLFFFGASVVGV